MRCTSASYPPTDARGAGLHGVIDDDQILDSTTVLLVVELSNSSPRVRQPSCSAGTGHCCQAHG